jgi:hypothetical protein
MIIAALGGVAAALRLRRGAGDNSRSDNGTGLRMRGGLATSSADRVSHSAIVVAGTLCGVIVFFVAMPLALSSPFPSPKEGEWVIHRSPVQAALPLPVPDVIEPQTVLESDTPVVPGSLVALPPSETASKLAPVETVEPESTGSIAPAYSLASVSSEPAPPPSQPKRAKGPMEEVDDYLWEVYQRVPVKKDGAGDFTWKDPAAAKRMGMSMPTYVVGGMDRDFREQLYHAGKAMDAAGIRWSMLSAFRDDYRQHLASGLKAGDSNSLHGGKARTGGYGHGQATDVTGVDGDENAVWRWIDRNGAKYGLYRPMPGADPAHVQSGGSWHRLAGAMREARLGTADDKRGIKTASATEKSARQR